MAVDAAVRVLAPGLAGIGPGCAIAAVVAAGGQQKIAGLAPAGQNDCCNKSLPSFRSFQVHNASHELLWEWAAVQKHPRSQNRRP